LQKTAEASNRVAFATTMAHLTALKRTSDLTIEQAREWYSVLGQFPNWMLNRAVIEMAVSETRFPEVGDLYRLCRKQAIKSGVIKLPYSANAGNGDAAVTSDEIKAIGAALGLKTDPNQSR
jgi:hypothetical protein